MKIYGMYSEARGFTLYLIPDNEDHVADTAEDYPRVIYFELGEVRPPLEEITDLLDSDWSCYRRFSCGHVQHACCHSCLDEVCPNC